MSTLPATIDNKINLLIEACAEYWKKYVEDFDKGETSSLEELICWIADLACGIKTEEDNVIIHKFFLIRVGTSYPELVATIQQHLTELLTLRRELAPISVELAKPEIPDKKLVIPDYNVKFTKSPPPYFLGTEIISSIGLYRAYISPKIEDKGLLFHLRRYLNTREFMSASMNRGSTEDEVAIKNEIKKFYKNQ